MQLHAVVLAPASVVEAALEAARDLTPSRPTPTADPKTSLVDRLLGRRQAQAPPASPVLTLSLAEPDSVFVRLAKFGNVTSDDAVGLARALETVAGSWPSPVLHVSRVVVAEAHPHAVTAQLDGDVGALRDIYDNVNEVARLQRFFLDRRNFRSELVLGSAQTEDDAALPDSFAGAEVPHAGQQWAPAHVTLLRVSFAGGGSTYEEVARIALSEDAEGLAHRTVS